MNPEFTPCFDKCEAAMNRDLEACFDKWEASFEALCRYLEDATTPTLAATPTITTDGVVGPVPASPSTAKLVTAAVVATDVPVLAASAASAKPLDIDATGVVPPMPTTRSTKCPSRDATAATSVFTMDTTPTSATTTVDVTPVLAAPVATNNFAAPSRPLQAAVPTLIHELRVLRPMPWPSFKSHSEAVYSEELLALFSTEEITGTETEECQAEETEQMCSISVQTFAGIASGSARVIQLHAALQGHELLILVDSGSSTSFINKQLADRLTGAIPLATPCKVHVADGSKYPCTTLFQWEIAWQLVATMQSERGVFTICSNRKRKFVTIDGVLGDLHPANPYEEEEFGSSGDSVQSVWSILSIHQLPLLGWTGSVVSLTSLDEGGSIHPACTGIVFYHAKTRACLLTSLSLFRSSDDYRKISFRTETKVRLPNDQVVSGIPIFHDLKSNLSVVSVLPKGCLLPAACLDHHQQLESHSQVVSVRCCFISGELLATDGMLAGDPTCAYREEAADEGLLVDSFGNFVGFNCYSKEGTTFIPRSTMLEFFWQLVSLDSEPSLKLPKFLVWPNKQHGELLYVSELYLEKFSGMFRQSLQGCESFRWTNDCSIPFGDYLCSNKTTEVHTPWDPGKSVLRYPLKRLGDKPSFKEGGMLGPSPAHVSLGRCLGPATTASAQLIVSFKSSSTNIQGKQRKRYPGWITRTGGGFPLPPLALFLPFPLLACPKSM